MTWFEYYKGVHFSDNLTLYCVNNRVISLIALWESATSCVIMSSWERCKHRPPQGSVMYWSDFPIEVEHPGSRGASFTQCTQHRIRPVRFVNPEKWMTYAVMDSLIISIVWCVYYCSSPCLRFFFYHNIQLDCFYEAYIFVYDAFKNRGYFHYILCVYE
jgi:hypothetical protein